MSLSPPVRTSQTWPKPTCTEEEQATNVNMLVAIGGEQHALASARISHADANGGVAPANKGIVSGSGKGRKSLQVHKQSDATRARTYVLSY